MAASLPDELRDLLALTLIPGLGPRLTQSLLETFGSAGAARRATPEELEQIPYISPRLAHEFAVALRNVDLEPEIAEMQRHGVQLLGRGMANYPSALANISDPPALLYFRGTILPGDAKAVAIVGSRRCTAYGRRVTESLAGGLARAGYTVISGLARGIDSSAHRGALDAGGRTFAILAGGLSSIYPPEHRDLAEEVAGHGALLSENPMRVQPQPGMFHNRNRIISGLARAVVVIEANDRSGALITARHAGEQGRDLFAIPANVDSDASAGTLRLLRDGARLIRGIDDLLEDLQGLHPADRGTTSPSVQAELPFDEGSTSRSNVPAGMDPTQQRIWEALAEAKFVDRLTTELGLPIADLTKHLFIMEMKRWVRRLPGNQYERKG